MSKIINSYLEQIYNTDNVTKRVNVACGIIFREIRNEKPALLLIQRDKDDHWPLFFEPPRGKCDNGDSNDLLKCLKREIKEETGLDIIPLKFIDSFQYTADKGTRLSTQHNFLCKMKDPDQPVKLSDEHQTYQWITTIGEAELMVLPDMKKSIAKAFEMIDGENQIFSLPMNDFTPTGTIEEMDKFDAVNIAGVIGIAGWGTYKAHKKRKKAEEKCKDADNKLECMKKAMSEHLNIFKEGMIQSIQRKFANRRCNSLKSWPEKVKCNREQKKKGFN